jgi:hypothetical protein
MKKPWTPNKPLSAITSERIRKIFVEEARSLLTELKDNPNTVGLAPAPNPKYEGHMIHVSISRAPDWYRKIYHSRNGFRRDLSLRALNQITRGLDEELDESRRGVCDYRHLYQTIYRQLIYERLTGGYKSEWGLYPANRKVKKYFNGKKSKTA